MRNDSPTSRTDAPADVPAPRSRRPLLWVLLVVAVVANGLTSLLGLPLAANVVTGVLALAAGGLLVRDHYRRRPRS